MAIKYKLGGEEIHKIAEVGAKRIRMWLDSSYRFRIDQTIYDLSPAGEPYTKLRLPQLAEGRFERFDLVGSILDERGQPGRTIYVECKDYSDAGGQRKLYDEYLAVCYSAFVKLSNMLGGPADLEFMWATTHPFAQTHYTELVTAQRIAAACSEHQDRLDEEAFDPSIADQLAARLWLAIVNRRVEEMIMGLQLRQAVVSKILELTP